MIRKFEVFSKPPNEIRVLSNYLHVPDSISLWEKALL